jgi:hypothetical protein
MDLTSLINEKVGLLIVLIDKGSLEASTIQAIAQWKLAINIFIVLEISTFSLPFVEL